MLTCLRCSRPGLCPPASGTEPVRITCRNCGASQTLTRAGKGLQPWKRQGPYTLACGCDSKGKNCDEAERIYAPIAEHYRRIAAGENSDDDLTAVRVAYRAHFD